MATNVIIFDDANDREGSKRDTTMSLVLVLNHCYQQKLTNKKRPLLPIFASIFTGGQ